MSSDVQLNICNVEKEKITRLFEAMCRCCCAQQNNLTSIFAVDNPSDEMIFTLTTVRFNKDDSYPQNICEDCFTMLSNCNSFRQQVQAADKFLREFKSAREEIQDEDDVSELPFDIQDTSDILVDFGLISDSDNEQNAFQEVIDIESDGDGSASEDDDDYNYKEEAEEDDVDNDNQNKAKNKKLPVKKKNVDLSCGTCKRTFASKDFFRKHMDEHSSTSFFSCSICYHKFSDQPELEEHMKRHSKKIIDEGNTTQSPAEPKTKCQNCEQEFKMLKDLEIHLSIHLPPNKSSKYACEGCSKLFDSLTQLKRHIPIHFIEKPYKCDTCGKGFPEMGSLTRHTRVHQENKKTRTFECSICKKKYFEAHALKIHKRTHSGEKPHSCDLCEKAFVDIRLLNSHKRTHKQERLFVCDECGQRFNHHSTLITHQRIHSGEKPFSCVVCQKSFAQASNLQVHIRTHSGERPYTCKVCGDSFTNSSTLKVHSGTHLNGKPSKDEVDDSKSKIICSYCDMKFISVRKLNLHKASHTVGKENRCKECNKSWSLRSYYIQHMKTVHEVDILEGEKSSPSLAVVEGYNDDAEMLNNEALVDALLNEVQQRNNEDEAANN